MDRLTKMQQWAARQYASQYGNNPWIQAMMKFMRGLKGNYGSSASGWGGGTLNAGQQAQAPAPKPPAQQAQAPAQKPPAQQAQAPAPKPPAQETSWLTPRGEDGNSNAGTSNQAPRSGGQIWIGADDDDWRSRFAEQISKLPKKDEDHLGTFYKGGNSSGYRIMPVDQDSVYHSMPYGHDSGYRIMPVDQDSGYHTMPADYDSGFSIMPVLPSYGNAQSAPILDYSPGITNAYPGDDYVMRVTSMPGVLGNVYPQWVTDYMMSNKPNSSGQGQGV